MKKYTDLDYYVNNENEYANDELFLKKTRKVY